jgi:hypothetical protein
LDNKEQRSGALGRVHDGEPVSLMNERLVFACIREACFKVLSISQYSDFILDHRQYHCMPKQTVAACQQ